MMEPLVQPRGIGQYLRRKRPKWSLVTSFLAAIAILAIVIPVVLVFLEKSLWVRLELITVILSFFMFVFLFVVLYRGVRFAKGERYKIEWRSINPENLLDASSAFDVGGLLTEALADAGPIGCLLGFLLDLVVSFFLSTIIACLFWLGLNLADAAITALFLPLFLLFRRSLRLVVARGRLCRGDVKKSFLYAFGYTAFGSIWLYLIFVVAHWIIRTRT